MPLCGPWRRGRGRCRRWETLVGAAGLLAPPGRAFVAAAGWTYTPERRRSQWEGRGCVWRASWPSATLPGPSGSGRATGVGCLFELMFLPVRAAWEILEWIFRSQGHHRHHRYRPTPTRTYAPHPQATPRPPAARRFSNRPGQEAPVPCMCRCETAHTGRMVCSKVAGGIVTVSETDVPMCRPCAEAVYGRIRRVRGT